MQPPLAEIFNYDELVAALRARAAEQKLALSAPENSQVSGLTDGYIAKLIGSNPPKRIGMASLGPILAVCGVKLVLLADEEAEQRYGPRLKRRNENLVHADVTYRSLTRRFMQKIGRKGGNARRDKLTPEQRSEIARNAVLARWSKSRIVKIKQAAT
jgi:hypothetical protein